MKKIIGILFTTTVFTLGSFVSLADINGDQANIEITEDNCLGEQDMSAADVDISICPEISDYPNSTIWFGSEEEGVSLGAWELGMTADGDAYKYGSLNKATEEQRTLKFYNEEKFTNVDALNIQCWAKGYYRLRQILQNPPEEYIKLRNAGFQTRFFQFQTDLRNGDTGFKKISSYLDHLVKWVTVIDKDGNCIQPTYDKFKEYAAGELERRGL